MLAIFVFYIRPQRAMLTISLSDMAEKVKNLIVRYKLKYPLTLINNSLMLILACT